MYRVVGYCVIVLKVDNNISYGYIFGAEVFSLSFPSFPFLSSFCRGNRQSQNRKIAKSENRKIAKFENQKIRESKIENH